MFITDVVRRADEVTRTASKALLAAYPERKDKNELEHKMRQGAGAMSFFKENRDLFVEMMICRAVDNYLTFLADLIRLIFLSRPEALRSAEQERLDFILRHDSINDLVTSIAEKKVHQLSYQGMDAISDYLSDRLGLDLFDNQKTKDDVVNLVQERNLIVHNRGIVNSVFIRKHRSETYKIGDKIDCTPDEFFLMITTLYNVSVRIDAVAAAKFNLRKTRRRRDR